MLKMCQGQSKGYRKASHTCNTVPLSMFPIIVAIGFSVFTIKLCLCDHIGPNSPMVHLHTKLMNFAHCAQWIVIKVGWERRMSYSLCIGISNGWFVPSAIVGKWDHSPELLNAAACLQ